MTLYEMAQMLYELDDRDFYEVMAEFTLMHGMTEEEMAKWLSDVIVEIKEIIDNEED